MNKNRIDEFIKNPKKSLFIIALPIIISMMAQTLYTIVDTAFVGRLGAESIAALTFAFPVFFILISVNAGIGIGTNSRIARYIGSKKRSLAENAAMHGLSISLLFALIVFILGQLFLMDIFTLLGASSVVHELATGYTSVILFGAFIMFPTFLLMNVFSGQGDTRTPMKVQVSALLLNIILDPIFIFYLGLGVKGAAYASIIAMFSALLMYIYFMIKKSYIRLSIRAFKPRLKMYLDILRVGIPSSMMMLTMSLYLLLINKLIVTLSTEHVAAFGINSKLLTFAFMPTVGFAIGLLTVVGMFKGAKRFDLLSNIVKFALKIAVAFTVFMSLVFIVFSGYLLRIFTSDSYLISIGIPYLRVESLTIPLVAVTLLIARAMQGLGHGLPGFVVNLVRWLIIGLPLSYIFVQYFGYGFVSIAWAMVIGNSAAFIVAIIWWFVKVRGLNAIRR